jgi:epoxyqueuosine reductase
VLDARKCISYLTIESRAPIPRELRPKLGDWLFGCDVCQEVCPWNREAPVANEVAFQPAGGLTDVNLVELFYLDDAQFRARFRHTPLWRPKRRGILRNAAIVLGNQADENAIAALVRGLEDEDALVRGACAWALGRYDDSRVRSALDARLPREPDVEVRAEIVAALEGC